MHILALALALSIVPASEPAPAPQAATPTFELPFSVAPPKMPEASAWKGTQVEGLVIHANVPEAMATGDVVTKWLTEQKICEAEVKICRFLIHFAMLDENPEKEDSTVIVRYIARGPKGTIAEGYASAPGKDTTKYRFYRRVNGAWTESTDANRTADYELLGNLTPLVDALARGGVLKVYRQ